MPGYAADLRPHSSFFFKVDFCGFLNSLVERSFSAVRADHVVLRRMSIGVQLSVNVRAMRFFRLVSFASKASDENPSEPRIIIELFYYFNQEKMYTC